MLDDLLAMTANNTHILEGNESNVQFIRQSKTIMYEGKTLCSKDSSQSAKGQPTHLSTHVAVVTNRIICVCRMATFTVTVYFNFSRHANQPDWEWGGYRRIYVGYVCSI